MNEPVYLIEITAWTGAAETVLRLSTCGYNTAPTDSPPNANYAKAVKDPGSFTRHLFGPNRTLGPSEASYGAIEVANANGALDAWIDYGFDGRPVVVKRLASAAAPYSSAETVLRGTIERLDADNAWQTLRLRVYDRRRAIDKPIQEHVFAGTTISGADGVPAAEGNVDLKDSVKPLCFGYCPNVPAVPVNAFKLIYQVNDGPVSSIVAYDGGVDLTLGVDHVNLTALKAAVIRPGKYDTCLALGLFRLGGAPDQAVTANVTEGSTAALRYPGAVVKRMLAKMALTAPADVNAASFAALDTLAPVVVGMWLDTQVNGLAAMAQVLASVGAWIAPGPTGAFEVGRLLAPGMPVGTITDREMVKDSFGIITTDDTDGGLPAWRVVVEYGKNWLVQDDAALGRCVDMDRRGFLAVENREVKAEAAAVRTKHLLSPELRISTLIAAQADGEAEAARRLALYSVRRDTITFDMRQEKARAFQLGVTVQVKHPRLGYKFGRNMVVIGRQENLATSMVTMTVWG
jgi:hypothetical protein